ncbi:membrane-bound lytic murein transglycosylase F [Litorivivens lipolytica]|uniref:Membrane-bound lytic murein transglycosylase F n=1 Tax=Litorivivens lipolytica TaxID=1524264 RepID=A0A7W4W1U4_9GAMM|nr:membrane-bound lytic murein transglycosylase MltF [Litorivivens lipolytica]MBB3045877.1 membrane-bound lytic murein transglycosylase F [Litorivivens lipolytica]
MRFKHLYQHLLLISALLLGACQEQDSLSIIEKEGTLKVTTRNGPTTYYENRGAGTGFEFVLAQMFADYLDVELEIIPVYGIEDLFVHLEKGRAQLAAASLTPSPERSQHFDYGPTYMKVRQFVIYRRGIAFAASIEDLIGRKVQVMQGSTQEETLRELQKEHPELSWEAPPKLETTDLLEMLEDGEIEFTVLDSNEYLANKGFYPQHRVAFSIGEPSALAWALTNKYDNTRLQKKLDAFFEKIRESGELASLVERFYGHNEANTQINSQTFVEAVESKLPDYKDLIETVALEYEIDWRLLAAISYQESYWNPRAVSPTGVKGMMMLTRRTAKEMGVTQRFDARQSLRGGARYFKKIHQLQDDDVPEPDRTWFALASYNIGRGHLEDARTLTKQQGGNPKLWKDVKERLPLLRQRKYYSKTRYGFARGDEAVHYVQNIRHYYSLLTWTEISKVRVPPPKVVQDLLPPEVAPFYKAL